MKKDFASIFRTPFEKIQISHYQSHWDDYDFQIISPSQPLLLQQVRFFQSVPVKGGVLGKEIEPWMTHCYFQSRIPMSGGPGDMWVYTDDSFSRAYFTRKLFATSLGAFKYDVASEFTRIFKNSPGKVNFSHYIRINDNSCFEVYSEREPLVLQEYCSTEKYLDLNSCTVEFPPWQKKEPWMTRYYYCSCPPELLEPQRDYWIFANHSLSRACVIIRAPGEPESLISRHPAEFEFAKIFKTPFPNIRTIAYYQNHNMIYFEVHDYRNHLELQNQCSFQNIDLKSCRVEFPPGRQKAKEPWMTKCYYYCRPATLSEPKEEFWIFINDDSTHASVVAQYEK